MLNYPAALEALKFGLSPYFDPSYVYASSDCYYQSAQLRMLACA